MMIIGQVNNHSGRGTPIRLDNNPPPIITSTKPVQNLSCLSLRKLLLLFSILFAFA